MHTSSSNHGGRTVNPAFLRWLFAALFGVTLMAIAATIGAKVQTGGTGRTEFGSIEAFGSIVVNGIHYDETAALITIDGVTNQPHSALKLGMVVQIDGSIDPVSLRGSADTVRVNRSLRGQVEAGLNSAGEIQVLSQAVVLTASTAFDGVAGGSTLVAGDWISVHGLEDPGRKTLVATLVERVPAPEGAQSTIRGTVRNAGGGQFRIGSLKISSSGLAAPGDNQYVVVAGDYAPGSGRMTASRISVTREVETREDNDTEITGYVTDFRSSSTFTLAGLPIDASGAVIEGGRLQDIKDGARVTVEGQIRNGMLIAEEIEVSSGTSATRAAGAHAELEGRISTFNSLADFTVKGMRIDATNAILVNKARVNPGIGLKVHAKGTVGSDLVLRARVIEIESR
jgi:hypothetical protein